MSPPVVAHVVQHLRPGGIESLALEMLRAEGRRARQIVISIDGDHDTAIRAWPRLEPFADRLRFLGKPPGVAPALPLRLARLLRREGVAVVQTHHVGPLLYGGMAARLAGARLVHVEHDAWHLAEARRARLVRGLVRLVRPRLVAVSDVVARAAEPVLGQPLAVIRNGVDLDRFRPSDRAEARGALGLGDLGEAPLVVCGARLEPVKGVDLLIDAMAGLPPAVSLVIAGDGSARPDLERQAARVAPGRVRFLGRIDAMPHLFAAGTVCALPSRAEGLPLSLLEAQAAGCPVVATAVGGVPDAVDPASGRVVSPNDPGALAEGLAGVLAAPAAASPRAFVAGTYGLPRMMDAYADLWAGAVA
jgi:glycosyltransferase involved in cell wall biosynthesis